MSAAELLARVEAAGGQLVAEDSGLKVRAAAPLPADLVAELRAHKAELLVELRNRESPATITLADGSLLAESGCGCLVCRPDLWPGGYREVLRAYPLWATQMFPLRVKWRMEGGHHRDAAERLSWLEICEEVRQRHKRGEQ